MHQQIVIAGGGQAAVQAVDTLRRKGFAGKLTLVGDEPWLPYQRPPLSKKYLAGALERERLMIRPAQFFADHQVQALLGRRVTEIVRRVTGWCCRTTHWCWPPAGVRAGCRRQAPTWPVCITCAPLPMPTASAPSAPREGAW